MHRATGRDTLRTIRRSLSRYLSIALIIAIGVAFFAGLTSSGSDMRLTADRYYADTHTQDMQILSTLGFSQADLDAIAAIDGVDQVAGSYFVDCLTISPDNFLTRVLSLPDNPWQGNEGYLNRLALLEGRVPKHDNECVIDQNIRDKYGFRLGDTLTLRSAKEGEDLSDSLANTAFTVVGVANSPLYIDASKRGATTVGDGSLDAWIYIPTATSPPISTPRCPSPTRRPGSLPATTRGISPPWPRCAMRWRSSPQAAPPSAGRRCTATSPTKSPTVSGSSVRAAPH